MNAAVQGKVKRKKLNSYKKAQRNTAILFLIPNFLGFMVFIVYPVLKSLYISFFNWDGLGNSEFIGLQNYIRLLQDSTFRISFLNNRDSSSFYIFRYYDSHADEYQNQRNTGISCDLLSAADHLYGGNRNCLDYSAGQLWAGEPVPDDTGDEESSSMAVFYGMGTDFRGDSFDLEKYGL